MRMPNVIEASPEWDAYSAIMNERPELFASSPLIDIETDYEKIRELEMKTGKKAGVVYKSNWNMMVVDVIKNKNSGEYSFYERVLPTEKTPPVVIIPEFNGEFVLIKQFRHAIRKDQIGFPRGFAEQGYSIEDNARKEIKEEINSNCLALTFLGTVATDSGLISTEASVFHACVSEPTFVNGHEGIKEMMICSEKEIHEMIKERKITDGFTLAALQLRDTLRK